MQIRPKRNAPDTAQFFEISVGDLRETGRLPNFATRQELIELCRDLGGAGGADMLRAMAAALGACWWGSGLELEVSYWEHRKELVRFGDLVLSELEDHGLDPSDILQAGTDCLSRLAGSVPSEDEVKEVEDFTAAEEGSTS